MDIDEKLIREVAKNAALELTDDEVHAFVPQFKEILESFSCLDEVDVKGIAVDVHPIKLHDALREDNVKPSLSQEEALQNTTHKKNGYFKGPKAF